MAYILPKTPSRMESMTTNDIETVGIGLVATSNSINNVFHSNNVTDVKIQTTYKIQRLIEILILKTIK
jgi:hypothetical protein